MKGELKEALTKQVDSAQKQVDSAQELYASAVSGVTAAQKRFNAIEDSEDPEIKRPIPDEASLTRYRYQGNCARCRSWAARIASSSTSGRAMMTLHA